MAAIQARSRRVGGGGLVRAVVNDGTDPDTLGGHVDDKVPVTPGVPERCASVARKNCQKGASTAKKRESVPPYHSL